MTWEVPELIKRSDTSFSEGDEEEYPTPNDAKIPEEDATPGTTAETNENEKSPKKS